MRLYQTGMSSSIAAKLENISGAGLFFTSSVPHVTGERLRCEISLPIKPEPHGEPAVLQCELTVVRTETLRESDDTVYGVACELSDYSVQLLRRQAVYWQVPSLAS